MYIYIHISLKLEVNFALFEVYDTPYENINIFSLYVKFKLKHKIYFTNRRRENPAYRKPLDLLKCEDSSTNTSNIKINEKNQLLVVFVVVVFVVVVFYVVIFVLVVFAVVAVIVIIFIIIQEVSIRHCSESRGWLKKKTTPL